jgi:hypothetical protein
VIEDLITSPGALHAARIKIELEGSGDEGHHLARQAFVSMLARRVAFWIHESTHVCL